MDNVDSVLEQIKRRRAHTVGDGNCLFNAVSQELQRLGVDLSSFDLRRRVAECARNHRKTLTRFKAVWDRDGLIGEDEYDEYIKQDGKWGNHFDVALISHLISPRRIFTINMQGWLQEHFPPRWEILQGKKRIESCDYCGTRVVTEDDLRGSVSVDDVCIGNSQNIHYWSAPPIIT